MQQVVAATLAFAMVAHDKTTSAQTAPPKTQELSTQVQLSPGFFSAPQDQIRNNDAGFTAIEPQFSSSVRPLFDFQDSEIKFKLGTLMNILRDGRHESWVLAPYPDPKTGRPLIGAGFNLEVMATEHIQTNPRNPHQFLEPSTVQLWQAAGLDLRRLQNILARYDHDLKAWNKKNFLTKIRTHQLPSALTEEEATKLLRISTIEAIHNAEAYCDEFEQMTGSQQMALSQLVFQMGINLEKFVRFLSVINSHSDHRDSIQGEGNGEQADEHWKTVQRTLVTSDWAKRYTHRAIAVIAMFDPEYDEHPTYAESQVQAQIRPLTRHRGRFQQAKRAVHHSARSSSKGGRKRPAGGAEPNGARG